MDDVIIHRDPGDENDQPAARISDSEASEQLIYDPIKINIVSNHVSIMDDSGVEKQIDADVINMADDDEAFKNYKEVVVSEDDVINGLITCPYTGSKDIYRISESVYASFESDEPFIVIINYD